jgi:hypothetical protein
MFAGNLNQTRAVPQARNIFKSGKKLLKPPRQPVENFARALQPPAQRVQQTDFRREQRDAKQ